MGVFRLAVGVVVLAFKCLCFSSLAFFHLRLLLRGRVLRVIKCVAFCCVIQVISLYGCRHCR